MLLHLPLAFWRRAPSTAGAMHTPSTVKVYLAFVTTQLVNSVDDGSSDMLLSLATRSSICNVLFQVPPVIDALLANRMATPRLMEPADRKLAFHDLIGPHRLAPKAHLMQVEITEHLAHHPLWATGISAPLMVFRESRRVILTILSCPVCSTGRVRTTNMPIACCRMSRRCWNDVAVDLTTLLSKE